MAAITIYRSDRSIWALPIRPDDAPSCADSPIFIAWPDDVPIARWSVYEFEPRPFASKDGASFRKLRMASVPIVIRSTAAVKLLGEGPKARLSVWWSPMGICAEAVYQVARAGERGMSIDGQDIDRVDRPVGQSDQGQAQGDGQGRVALRDAVAGLRSLL